MLGWLSFREEVEPATQKKAGPRHKLAHDHEESADPENRVGDRLAEIENMCPFLCLFLDLRAVGVIIRSSSVMSSAGKKV